MSPRQPTDDEILAAAAELGFDLTAADCGFYRSFMDPDLEAYEFIETAGEPKPALRVPDRGWWRPEPDENEFGAWQARTEIRTDAQGPLTGRSVALSDNICLADVPMAIGTSFLRDFRPDRDATVVNRLLDSGATITGKAHCEYLGIPNGSHTSAAGPVRNPRRPAHSSGGAASGAAALVASGAADLAVGTDASGSVRVPAAWSGVVGLKPTHGLIPYAGILPLESSLDDVGPITATVADNALLLDVLVGASTRPEHSYSAALTGECAGMRVGVVKEGFELPDLEADVADTVRGSCDVMRILGAHVEDVVVPAHQLGVAVWDAIALEGHTDQLLAAALGGEDPATDLAQVLRGWQAHTAEFPRPVKVAMVMGNVFRRRHGGVTYRKAQRLAHALADAYDDALANYDVLVMPTTPMKATELPSPQDSPEGDVRRAFEMVLNVVPSNASGHPALSVPCGMRDGLPVGMQFIARRHAESTLYRIAHAYESARRGCDGSDDQID